MMRGGIAALLFVMLSVAGTRGVRAVGVSLESGSGVANQTVDIGVATTSVSGLGVQAFQFSLTFDGSLLEVVGVQQTATLSASWGDATFNTSPGTVAVSHAGETPLAGSGQLIRVRFRVRPTALSGGYSTIHFQGFLYNEGNPAASTTDGSITIQPTPSVRVDPSSGEIARGQTLQFFASGSVTLPVTWGSTNPSVASISTAGELTGIAVGAVRVFVEDAVGLRDTTDNDVVIRGTEATVGTAAVLQGHTGSVPVTVSNLTGLGINAGQVTIRFDPGMLTPLGVSTTGTLLSGFGPVGFGRASASVTIDFIGSTVLSGSGTLFQLNFTTAADRSGVTTLELAEALFNENLPAKRRNGSLNVNPLPSISVGPDQFAILAGQTYQMYVSGNPTPPITWTSLQPSVAMVNASGILSAIRGGVTRVQAVDAIGAVDENSQVVVLDFQVSLPNVDVYPGQTAVIPLLVDRSLDAMNILAVEYTLGYASNIVTAARVRVDGLTAIWGAPWTNQQSDRLLVATAGAQPLGTGTSYLHHLELDVSPAATPGTASALTLSGFRCNEGTPSAQVVNGSLQIRNVSEASPLPASRLMLGSGQPNPFTTTTRIEFSLPGNTSGIQSVRLRVYDPKGRTVRMLVDAPLGAGLHNATWDGRDELGGVVPAGLYWCRLESSGESVARKIVILR